MKTLFDGRYIVSYEVYGGYNESFLFDAVSGITYDMNSGSGFKFGCFSDGHCHVTIDVSWDSKNEKKGFLNDKGELYLMFEKEEF